MRALCVLLVALCLVASGCFRTRYVNLYSEQQPWPREARTQESAAGSWQNFWVFGWFPTERTVRSQELCTRGVVQEIETRQTFAQGLVAALIAALILVPIYSPWDGKTICYQ